MKYIKKFNESNGEEISETVNDILLELIDDGFDVAKAEYWVGGRVSYGRTAENIKVTISNNIAYTEADIMEVYGRICNYLESEGFKKDLIARNGYVGAIPHMDVFHFFSRYSSRFSFSRI